MNSQVIKKRAKRSQLWAYFSVQDDKVRNAECDLCGKKFSYKSTVTNLRKHIQRKHPGIKIKFDNFTSPPVRDTSAKNTSGTDDFVDMTALIRLPEKSEKSEIKAGYHDIGTQTWEEAVESEVVYADASTAYYEENAASSTSAYETTVQRTSEFQKIIEYLQERNDFVKRDDLDFFFESICHSTRKLPRKLQNKIKMGILDLVSKAEEEFEDEQANIK